MRSALPTQPEVRTEAKTSPDSIPDTAPPYGDHIPPSKMEALPIVTRQTNRICYFISADHKGDEISPYGKQYFGFSENDRYLKILKLVKKIGTQFLPEQAGERFPRQDFLAQQILLSLLAKGGRYSVPPVCLTFARNRDGVTEYENAVIYATHISNFRIDPDVPQYEGSLCWINKHPITEEEYSRRVQKGELVLPLPQDILRYMPPAYLPNAEIVLNAFELSGLVTQRFGRIRDAARAIRLWITGEITPQQNILQLPQTVDTVSHQPTTNRNPQDVTLSKPTFRNREDLKRIINFDSLPAVLDATDDPRLLWEFHDLIGDPDGVMQPRLRRYLDEHHEIKTTQHITLYSSFLRHKGAFGAVRYYGRIEASYEGQRIKIFTIDPDNPLDQELAEKGYNAQEARKLERKERRKTTPPESDLPGTQTERVINQREQESNTRRVAR